MKTFFTLAFVLSTVFGYSQITMLDSLPYHKIPDYPETHSAAHTVARMVDGLGFRFYWASADLTEKALHHELGNECRTIAETYDHMVGLATMVHNTILGKPNVRPREEVEMTLNDKRAHILHLLKEASDHLRDNGGLDMEQRPIVFQRGDKTNEISIWHLYNGPLADALWHCGQIVTIRRAAGDPLPSGVNVFMGERK